MNDVIEQTEALPWWPVATGFRMKVLHGERDEETRAVLLELLPGTVIGRHRHTGEVHAVTLRGQRKLIDTGEVVGAGGYVYEPPGNEDSWMAVGDEPLIVFVTVRGVIESLDANGQVTERMSTGSVAAGYQAFLKEQRR